MLDQNQEIADDAELKIAEKCDNVKELKTLIGLTSFVPMEQVGISKKSIAKERL